MLILYMDWNQKIQKLYVDSDTNFIQIYLCLGGGTQGSKVSKGAKTIELKQMYKIILLK